MGLAALMEAKGRDLGAIFFFIRSYWSSGTLMLFSIIREL